MLRSLRAQLSLIFLGFLLLVVSSVVVTFLAIQTQQDDASVINLAGRQRMLTQKMTWLALTQPASNELNRAIELFDQTLYALRDGGQTFDSSDHAVTLPAPPDAALRAQIGEAVALWTIFRVHLQSGDEVTLQNESPRILAQLDSIVSAFEARAQAKIARLQLTQFIFLLSALLLLALGYLVTRRRIVQPLTTLNSAAQRIAEGNLGSPIPPMGNDELGELGQAFETMRAEVAASRQELETRVNQRTREIASAFEFTQEIVAQLDLEHLLQSVTDRARLLARGQAALLCLMDADHAMLTLAAQSGKAFAVTGLHQPVRRGLARRVVSQGETAIVDVTCSHCRFLETNTAGQCAAAPLCAGDSTLGALCVVREASHPFDLDETRALTLLANSAAIAIANARLAEAGRHQAERAATLAERERLAAELHDHLAQTLSFVNLKTDRVKENIASRQWLDASADLDRVKQAIGAAYGQVRTALVGLREPPATAGDFVQKLNASVNEFRETANVEAQLIVNDPSAVALPAVAQTQALLIIREALNNARRHAQAKQVSVIVERVNNETRVTVQDDGCGFDPYTVASDTHLGIAIMRVRAERSGGTLRIESAKDSGTKVTAVFPL